MKVRLIDAGWDKELADAITAYPGELRIICPFIKAPTISRLLSRNPRRVQVITRFNLADFARGVSDIEALRLLLKAGASVRGIRHLHAKLYQFGTQRVIVTSANLTTAALQRNHEFGMVSEEFGTLDASHRYFERLWRKGKTDLTQDQVDDWDRSIARYRARGGRPSEPTGLGDFGADAGFDNETSSDIPTIYADPPQAFVKFIGWSANRVSLNQSVEEQIEISGCHWAFAYPENKRPTGVREGALIFASRLTRDPNDIRIFGRAIGMKYVPGRDDASPADIRDRSWKKTWPRYIRLHHAEFIAGTMANGVSLNELMDSLGADSFAATQRNAANGRGNTDPRGAYRQQAAVKLSAEGLSWLNERLQAAFDRHGKVPDDTLDQLDWPMVPNMAQGSAS